MFLLEWYERFLQIRLEASLARIQLNKEKVCESCEYLKLQNEKQLQTINDLISRLVNEPETVTQVVETREIPKPRHMPFAVRRQILESQDKIAAQKMRESAEQLRKAKVNISPSGGVIFQQPETKVAAPDDPDVIALEREMDLVTKEREAQR